MEKISKDQFLFQIFDYKHSSKLSYQANHACLILFWKNGYESNSLLFDFAEQLENRFQKNIELFSVDVDQEALLAADLGIRKIPTWLFIPIQKDAFMIHGIPEMDEIQKIIENKLIP